MKTLRTELKQDNIFTLDIKKVNKSFKKLSVLADQIADTLLCNSNRVVIVK